MNKWAAGLMLLGASVVSGLLTYGTYGYLTDKKKWSSWKAGAAIGAISGGLGLAAVLAGAYPTAGLGALPGSRRPTQGYMRVLKSRNRSVPRQFGALVMERVAGCGTCA